MIILRSSPPSRDNIWDKCDNNVECSKILSFPRSNFADLRLISLQGEKTAQAVYRGAYSMRDGHQQAEYPFSSSPLHADGDGLAGYKCLRTLAMRETETTEAAAVIATAYCCGCVWEISLTRTCQSFFRAVRPAQCAWDSRAGSEGGWEVWDPREESSWAETRNIQEALASL